MTDTADSGRLDSVPGEVLAAFGLTGSVPVRLDALMWHRASPEVLRLLAGERELGQLLARALVYRLVTEIVRHAGTAGVAAAARAAAPVTGLVLARLPAG